MSWRLIMVILRLGKWCGAQAVQEGRNERYNARHLPSYTNSAPPCRAPRQRWVQDHSALFQTNFQEIFMGTTITLTAADGHKFSCYKAEPAGKPKGAIVVIQE